MNHPKNQERSVFLSWVAGKSSMEEGQEFFEDHQLPSGNNQNSPCEGQGSLASRDTKSNDTNQEGSDSDIGGAFSNNQQHVCHTCNKSFKSGKALGGHMRIHTMYKTKSNALKAKRGISKVLVSNSSSTTCCICNKTFTNRKSLFGHMRCHPERRWRGINPPNMKPNKVEFESSNSSVSSNLSNDSSDHVLDWRWSVRGKRSQKSLSNWNADSSPTQRIEIVNDPEVVECAHVLMLLSRGNPKSEVEVAKDQVQNMSSISLTKKLKFEVEKLESDFVGVMSKNKNSFKKKKVVKKMKLTLIGAAEKKEKNKLDSCSIYSKVFQSLKKCKGKSIQIMGESESDFVLVKEKLQEKNHANASTIQEEKTETATAALGSLTMKEDIEGNQSKTFSNGQVSKDHKISNSTQSAQSTSAATENGQKSSKILNFDLNELPMDEDELDLFDPMPSSFPHASSSKHMVTN